MAHFLQIQFQTSTEPSHESWKMNNPKNRSKPVFTAEFKKDAVSLVIEKGYTHEQAATNLGVSQSALSRWVRTEKSASQQGSVNVDEKAELAKLRKQNAQLKMEREILKKAAVFLAREVE